MRPDEVLAGVRDAMTVKRVFGEPYERNGVTVIPAAAVRGGGGGGGGSDDEGHEGGGVGYGIEARPVGAYVIKDGQVSWVPAVDASRIAVLGNIVGIVAILTVGRLLKTVSKRRSS